MRDGDTHTHRTRAATWSAEQIRAGLGAAGSIGGLAKQFGCKYITVYQAMKRYGITLREIEFTEGARPKRVRTGGRKAATDIGPATPLDVDDYHGPTITIGADGTIFINSAAFEELGRPESIHLHAVPDGVIGLSSGGDCKLIHKNGSARKLDARGFLRRNGYQRLGELIRFKAQLRYYDGLPVLVAKLAGSRRMERSERDRKSQT